MIPQKAYEELVQRGREISTLASSYAVLEWDHQVNMPPQGSELRAEQTSQLYGIIHQIVTDPRIDELLHTCEDSDLMKDPESIEAANIHELRHQYDKEKKLPKDFVEEFQKTTSLAHNIWAEARGKNDFSIFKPSLDKILDMCRKKADYFGYEGEPYNALLDNYEPGATVEEIGVVFEKLQVELVELLQKIQKASDKPDKTIIEREYDVNLQKIFGEMVAASMGYDFKQGRLDIATHPFTIGMGPGDTRITTRYNPKRINDALFGTIHEAGHALYEMGLDKKNHFGTPVGESASLGIHESQSRMWENNVGRSRSFWNYYYPIAQRIFRKSLIDVSLDDFYRAVNFVEPSLIRVEADEVTYSLHIMLRFEIERAMLKGEIKTADVPGEWNSRFEKYLGIKVDSDRNGCLQDVHWSGGSIGYFPTYCLGSLYAAQFFAKAKKDMPDLDEQIGRGELLKLREWLRENIHKHGLRYRAGKLCEKVTGAPLSHKPMMDYLNTKFKEIYKL